MQIFVENKKISDVCADVLILPVFIDVDNSSADFAEFYEYAQNDMGYKSKLNEILVLPTYKKISAKNILFVGLGETEEFTFNKFRAAISKAFQKLSGMKNIKNIAVAYNFAFEDVVLGAETIVEGALIGLYKFDKYKSEKKEDKIETIALISENEADTKAGIEAATIYANAVNNARDLINEPAEFVTPEKLAQLACEIQGIETKIYNKAEIENMGMGAFLAVGQGSRHEPKFIHMKYSPKGEKTKTVAIVGKGITFDSGGLDIKPAASMLDMKGDMAGAAAVLSVMRALVELEPSVEVHGIIAACENMPSAASYKPGDVLTAMNGKTIEVDNTDAEGRLTLADALCFAETLNPDSIIDVATLTGACCVALGKIASGLLGNDPDLIENLRMCGENAGEYLWEMPMFEEYFDDLKSDIADFKNAGTRYGGTSAAALFLKKFIKNTPWAHIDIAGTSIVNKPLREFSKGPTGAGVRTLLIYISNL